MGAEVVSHELAHPEVLVLLSGGVDSTACVQFFLDLGRPAGGMFLDYQQPALKQEALAAHRVANYYGIQLVSARWVGNRSKGPGLILGRNAFLLSAALMELPEPVSAVAVGIHAGTGYADCTADFIQRMQTIYDLYRDGRVKIVAPFVDWTKGEIFAYVTSTGAPLNLTYSCEAGGDTPCMRCASCLDRKLLDE